jgi:two-component system, OmpR family, phosphate regulon sensor histidine kinase PhoR
MLVDIDWQEELAIDPRFLLTQALGASDQGFMVMAPGRKVVYLNDAARRLLDYRGSIPEALTSIVPDLDLSFAVGDVLHDRRPTVHEGYAPHPDRLLHWQLVPALTHAGEPAAVVGVIEDVTRVRHLETVRRDFVTNVSHELRTPLSSMSLMLETLQRGAMHDPEAAIHFLGRMEVEIVAMTRLVEELLELSKIESGRLALNPQPTAVRAALERVISRLAPASREKELHIQVDSSELVPDVMADPERLEQVLMNLTHNAIKFTPRGGRVTLRAYQQGRGVLFEVCDTGIGMDPGEASRVFERFYKIDRGRSRGGGTGLGLAIARHLLDLHGSRLQVISERGHGSRFSFSLAAAPSRVVVTNTSAR